MGDTNTAALLSVGLGLIFIGVKGLIELILNRSKVATATATLPATQASIIEKTLGQIDSLAEQLKRMNDIRIDDQKTERSDKLELESNQRLITQALQKVTVALEAIPSNMQLQHTMTIKAIESQIEGSESKLHEGVKAVQSSIDEIKERLVHLESMAKNIEELTQAVKETAKSAAESVNSAASNTATVNQLAVDMRTGLQDVQTALLSLDKPDTAPTTNNTTNVTLMPSPAVNDPRADPGTTPPLGTQIPPISSDNPVTT